jgi:hypothetical protein
MNIETVRSFFLWCTIINYGLLLWWSFLFMFAHDWMFRLWAKLLRVSAEQFNVLNIGGITVYKLGIILFNIVPCVVLYIIA